jgi:hypothetical protein
MLVVGVPMGLFLTAALWHLVGVADAVLLSQLLRHSADQVAFESAIWHARGMNVIAVLNLLMTSLAGVFVAWRILEVAVPMAGTLCIPQQASCEGHTYQDGYDLGEKLVDHEHLVVDWLGKQVVRVSDLERATSTVTPVIALTRASELSGIAGGSWLRFAMPLTGSLVPDQNVPALTGIAGVDKYPRMNLGPDMPSLPIEAASQARFCGMAAPLVPDMAKELLTRLNANWVNRTLKEAKYDIETAWPALGAGASCLGQKADVATIWEGARYRPQRYHEFVFQIWAVSYGRFDKLKNDDEFVSLAGKGTIPKDVKDNWTVSQAEFYFECSDLWSKCQDSALQGPNWTARLRRVRVPDTFHGGASLWGAIRLPPGFSSLIPADVRTQLDNDQYAVWDRVRQLIH